MNTDQPSAMYSKTFLKPSEFLSILFHFGSKLKPNNTQTSCQRPPYCGLESVRPTLSHVFLRSFSLSLSLLVSQTLCSLCSHSRLAVFQFSPTLTRCQAFAIATTTTTSHRHGRGVSSCSCSQSSSSQSLLSCDPCESEVKSEMLQRPCRVRR